MGAFGGFGKDALGFFRALKFHQDKAWFDANRAIYDEQVVAPLAALLDDLTTAFARKKIPLRADSKKSIFRIHRDVRFAKDKSPYKTHAGAVMTRTGGRMEPGLLYIHVDPEGCFVAAGFYMPDSAALNRMRTAIARNNGKTFLKVAGELERAKLRFAAHGDELSRVPRGFEAFKGTPVEGSLRKKSLIVEQRLSDRDIASPKLPATIVDFTERAMPLLKFGWVALD
jgi:uncharacterized protein (TIGR02453 family)